MNHAVRVQVLERIDDLLGVALDLKLVESLPPLEKLVHALVLTKFEQNIYILAVFEEVDRKSTRLNSSHSQQSRMPSSA